MDSLRALYLLSLGGFHQQTLTWAASARSLNAAALAAGDEVTDAAAQEVYERLVTELRALVALSPGIRQLLADALRAG